MSLRIPITDRHTLACASSLYGSSPPLGITSTKCQRVSEFADTNHGQTHTRWRVELVRQFAPAGLQARIRQRVSEFADTNHGQTHTRLRVEACTEFAPAAYKHE